MCLYIYCILCACVIAQYMPLLFFCFKALLLFACLPRVKALLRCILCMYRPCRRGRGSFCPSNRPLWSPDHWDDITLRDRWIARLRNRGTTQERWRRQRWRGHGGGAAVGVAARAGSGAHEVFPCDSAGCRWEGHAYPLQSNRSYR